MRKRNHVPSTLFNVETLKQKLSLSMYPGVNVCHLSSICDEIIPIKELSKIENILMFFLHK